MREIEIKARVKNLDTIRTLLQEKGIELSTPVMHHDVVWGPKGRMSEAGVPWLRLRR